MQSRQVRLADMTWEEVGDALKTCDTVVLPVGATEQHGPHMPLITDSIMVQWLAETAAERIDGVLVAPTIVYGVSANHMDFPGTVTLQVETLKAVLVDAGVSLLGHGFRNLVILNGHGGNNATTSVAGIEIRRRCPNKVVGIVYTPSLIREGYKVLESDIVWHADEWETSAVLAAFPEKVKMERAVRTIPEAIPLFEFTEEALVHSIVEFGLPRTQDVSKTGTIGDATLASAEKGEVIMDEAITTLASVLTDLREGKAV